MTAEQEEKLLAFASKVARQQCMPPLWRFLPPSRWNRGIPWRFLRAFLVSRLDSVKEDPNPGLWAREFIKAGGTTRLLVWMLLIFCGSVTVI